jgi:hypothetical protein
MWQLIPFSIEHSNKPEPVSTVLTQQATLERENVRQHLTLNWVDEQNPRRVVEKNTCNIVRDIGQNNFIMPIEGLHVIAPGNFLEVTAPLQYNEVAITNMAIIALMSGLNNAIFLQKVSFHPSLSPTFFEEIIALCKPFHSYAGPDYLILTNELLDPACLILPTGDRLTYIPSLRKESFRYEELSSEKYTNKKNAIRMLNGIN